MKKITLTFGIEDSDALNEAQRAINADKAFRALYEIQQRMRSYDKYEPSEALKIAATETDNDIYSFAKEATKSYNQSSLNRIISVLREEICGIISEELENELEY